MSYSVYEPHIMKNKALPFIIHRDLLRKTHEHVFNWHPNIEILRCVAGEGYVTVDDCDIPFNVGEIVVINSNRLHKVSSAGMVEYDVLIVDRKFCAENGIPTEETLFEDCIFDAELCKDFDNVIECCDRDARTRTAEIRSAVLKILIRLYAEHTVSENAESASSATVERIKNVVRFIRQNFEEELTLEEIAAHVGVSKFHLSREFKRFSGQTVFEHINAVRCKEAKRLMEEGMSVSAAAMSCGFNNMSYFSRTYKRYTGVLPSAVSGKGENKV